MTTTSQESWADSILKEDQCVRDVKKDDLGNHGWKDTKISVAIKKAEKSSFIRKELNSISNNNSRLAKSNESMNMSSDAQEISLKRGYDQLKLKNMAKVDDIYTHTKNHQDNSAADDSRIVENITSDQMISL